MIKQEIVDKLRELKHKKTTIRGTNIISTGKATYNNAIEDCIEAVWKNL